MAGETESEIRRQRIEKAKALAVLQGRRYPNDFRVSHCVAEAVAEAGDRDAQALEEAAVRVSVAGRVVGLNSFGKSTFLRVRDRTGTLQVYVRLDRVGEGTYQRVRLTDVGDVVGVEGVLFRTRTNELTVQAGDYRVLSKCLRPLPEKWHGLKDRETRCRMRYVDLIVNEESRRIFEARTRVIQYLRRFLDERGFLEVETPMMHSVLGGANARPFMTHHNALDMDLYLRIAPELYLKRLVVGGFERVYEINRNFRNEGVSTRHNPEFTMLEFYWAYATYEDLMDLTETLFRGLAREVCGREQVGFAGETIDFGRPFCRLTVCDALQEYCGAREDAFHEPEAARAFALGQGVPEDEVATILARHRVGRDTSREARRDAALDVCMAVFEDRVQDQLVQPTFVTRYPAVVSPLARRSDDDPTLVDRFELMVAGGEVANAFSELNDPADQEERFREQVRAKAAGDAEAMEYDEDYIRALEYGLPPTAGEGIGIDRLTMILTGQENIRDVILFPLMRPES